MADTCYKPITIAILAGALLAGCGGAPQRTTPPSDTAYRAPAESLGDRRRQQVVDTALQALGTPYRYGGHGPRGFDCSGLVQYSHAAAGVAVPRVTTAQRRDARPVALRQLRPGICCSSSWRTRAATWGSTWATASSCTRRPAASG